MERMLSVSLLNRLIGITKEIILVSDGVGGGVFKCLISIAEHGTSRWIEMRTGNGQFDE